MRLTNATPKVAQGLHQLISQAAAIGLHFLGVVCPSSKPPLSDRFTVLRTRDRKTAFAALRSGDTTMSGQDWEQTFNRRK
jgi:hypothetical protein